MYKDFAAIHRLNGDIKGRSIHRRGLNSPSGKFTDLHIRMPTRLLQSDDVFSPIYCQQLGEELSGLDGQLFQSYLSVLYSSVSEGTVVGAANVVRDNQIYLVTPEEDGRLFELLRNTIFSVVINNFMSKFFPLSSRIYLVLIFEIQLLIMVLL